MDPKTTTNDKQLKKLGADTLIPQYLKALEECGSITIPVSGSSMAPFLGHLRDSVTLVPAEGKKLKTGDIVLYTRQGKGLSAYIMHRIVGKKDGAFVLCGDGQTIREYGVRRESVIAVAVGATRKGKRIAPGSPVWFFFRHIWRLARPIRPALLRVFGGRGSKR